MYKFTVYKIFFLSGLFFSPVDVFMYNLVNFFENHLSPPFHAVWGENAFTKYEIVIISILFINSHPLHQDKLLTVKKLK